jgi:hypothetical protein
MLREPERYSVRHWLPCSFSLRRTPSKRCAAEATVREMQRHRCMPTNPDPPIVLDEAPDDPDERAARKLMVPLGVFLAIVLFLAVLYRVIVA